NGTATVTGCTAPMPATPATTSIYVCQRGLSSGAERSAGVFFENEFCTVGTRALDIRPATCSTDGCSWSPSFLAAKNFAGAGTGDLLACLQAHDQAGQFAIGFASTLNGWGTFQSNSDRRDFRFTRVNGVAPSIENVAAGRYRWWVESVGY